MPFRRKTRKRQTTVSERQDDAAGAHPERPEGPPAEELVSLYLRAQNLEQVERVDEAVPLYEQAVSAGFDAAGPYDRLIAIYHRRENHAQVQRVATAALRWVRTFDDKRKWYEAMRSGAEEAARSQPDPRGAEF